MTYRIMLIVVMMAFLSHIPVFAQPWQADKDHTGIGFEINHILTTVSGTFTDYDAELFFDPEQPEKGKFNFTVRAKRVDTNIEKRDVLLVSKDFFYADTYPEIKFASRRITKSPTHDMRSKDC